MFAKEGVALIIGAAVIALVLSGMGWVSGGPLGWALIVFGLILLGFTMYFFRDPYREIPVVPINTIMSPADGKVLLIDEIDEPLYFHGPALKISIFLSPLNVHVNRIPTTGMIELDEYVPGEYLVAWHEKASELNERSQLGLMHPSGHKVLFKQIAGAVARRIVYHVTVGDSVQLGDRFGIVKFGSRMDVIIPRESTVSVSIGDKVVGGTTILGYLPQGVRE